MPGTNNPNTSGRQSRRREATRKRLLAAALVVFERDGFADATIGSITEEADVGFGTFYLYFDTKKTLYESVLRQGFAELADHLEETDRRAEADGIDWRDRIVRYVTTYYEFAATHRALYRIMFASREAGVGLGRGLREPFTQQLNQWLRTAQQHGQTHPGVESRIVAVGLVAALNRTGVWWMQQQGSGDAGVPSQADIVATMSRFVLAVLEGPASYPSSGGFPS